jgi:hypothetical protein
LIWWYNWRYLPHMKDEALSPKGESMELLPIANPTETVRFEIQAAVERQLSLTQERRATVNTVLDWLRLEFDVDTPGQNLSKFWALDVDAFLREVKARRARSAGRLSPAAMRVLQSSYEKYAPWVRTLRLEIDHLERRLADLVNEAYGLTPEEEALLWQTAPPRMPIAKPSA